MAERTTYSSLYFSEPFLSAGELLPAGTYEIMTDEETIDGLSFEAWRRKSAFVVIRAPGRTELRSITKDALDQAVPANAGAEFASGDAAPSPLEDDR